MLVSKDYYFLNLLLVCLVFYLFVFLISIFGFIFLYYFKRTNEKVKELNFIESFIISFGIGISIYISFGFVLDIFLFYNFYSGYLSIIIIDCVFILFLVYNGVINRETIGISINSFKKKFKSNSKESLIFITIIIFIVFLQIIAQWEIVTKKYSLLSRDTYGWTGQLWFLLEKGYLWRDRLVIHYPKGYTFFLAGPLLIFPDFRLAYFYYKFGSIPFFSLYLIILGIMLKKIFKKNYLIFTGLVLTLISNTLFARFSNFSSSILPSLLILISLIILRTKCPFYLLGFFISTMFLCNALFAFYFIIILLFLILTNLLYPDKLIKLILKDDIAKTLILTLTLLLPYIFHTMIVLNISFIEFINGHLVQFGITIVKLPHNSNFGQIFLMFSFSNVLDKSFPDNKIISGFLDLEKRLFSFFIIFSIVSLFLSTKKHFEKQYREIVNFIKLSLLLIIFLYLGEAFSSNISNIFFQNLDWFKWRAIEAFAGPITILCCFIFEKIIKKSKIITSYLLINYGSYRKLMSNKFLSKFLRIEYIVLSTLLVSVFSTYIIHHKVYYSYYFEQEEIDTIFYIKEHVPEDSKILVHYYDGMGDALHSLLSTYRLYDREFSENENDILEIKEYIKDKNIEYVLLDLSTLNSTELYNFTSDYRFDKLYENDVHIFFEYEG